jgi:hypothetical protein
MGRMRFPFFGKKSQPSRQPIPNGLHMANVLGIHDGLYEEYTGLGGENDATQKIAFYAPPPKSEREIEDAITWSGVMETFAHMPAEDALANPLEFPDLSNEEIQGILEYFGPDETDLWVRLEEAYATMRRTGFAAIWLNTEALDNSLPMAEGEMRRLRELIVFDADCMDADPNGYSQYDNEPKHWVISDPDYPHTIHKSRLLIFPGRSASKRRRWENRGKGDSEMLRVWDAWLYWRAINAVSPYVAQTFEQRILFLEQYNQKMGNPQGRKNILAKLFDIAKTASKLKIIAMDAGSGSGGGERFERAGIPLTGLPDIYDRSERFMVAESGQPYDYLLGKLVGGGLGGKGESDGGEQKYHKYIARQQRKWLARPIQQFLKKAQPELKRIYRKPFESLRFEFAPLRQLSDKEWAEIQEINSRRDKNYLDHSVLSVEESREHLAKDGVYNLEPRTVPDIDPESLEDE